MSDEIELRRRIAKILGTPRSAWSADRLLEQDTPSRRGQFVDSGARPSQIEAD
jgi:hypothetical protein